MSINEEDKGRSSEIKDQLSNEILQKLPKSCMQSSLGYFTHALGCAFIIFYRAFLSIVISSPALLHIVFSIKTQHLSVLSQGFWKIKGTLQAAEAEDTQLGVMTLSPHCWHFLWLSDHWDNTSQGSDISPGVLFREKEKTENSFQPG